MRGLFFVSLLAVQFPAFSQVEPNITRDFEKLISSSDICKISLQENIDEGRSFLVEGRYMSDMHRAMLELRDCSLVAGLSEVSKEKFEALHQAYKEKCDITLIGDFAQGFFKGYFKKRPRYSAFNGAHTVINFFCNLRR